MDPPRYQKVGWEKYSRANVISFMKYEGCQEAELRTCYELN